MGFHNSSLDVTLGVPRIKEIIDGAKRISTPIIDATLECNNDDKVAKFVKGCIAKTVLGEVCIHTFLGSFSSYILVLPIADCCILCYYELNYVKSTPFL